MCCIGGFRTSVGVSAGQAGNTDALYNDNGKHCQSLKCIGTTWACHVMCYAAIALQATMAFS